MENLMADFKAQHEALHTKNARLAVELAEVYQFITQSLLPASATTILRLNNSTF